MEAPKYWELDSTDAHQITDVQGRLKQKLSFWKNILHAPPPILDWVECGYCLPLKFLPPPYAQNNHNSTREYGDFVTEAVSNLVANRCARQVNKQPYLCNPLLVVKNSTGKLRLVLNLKYLNQFLENDHFKYEDLRIAAVMFQQHELLFKFDLKSGYHHVDIYPDHQKYLGFQWGTKESVCYYVFTVLPFGLSTACYLFTKLTRPLIKLWRGRGLKAIIYIDDGIIAVKGEDKAKRESLSVRKDLESAGFVVNIEKSQWEPCKSLEWLWFGIDLNLGVFSVPDRKIEELQALLRSMSDHTVVPARRLASLIGKIMSMSIALGTVTRLMTRNLYAVLNLSTSWCQEVPLTQESLQEVEFWLSEIGRFNGHGIWPKPSAVRVVYSDASSTGYGGYMVEHGHLVANGLWSDEEARRSSTWRELKAVRMVLESFQEKLRNERVRWFTDNQNVVRVVQYGSKKPDLQTEALAIFSTCLQQHIRIEPEWIPRDQNEQANYISRLVDYDDWMLNSEIFHLLDAM